MISGPLPNGNGMGHHHGGLNGGGPLPPDGMYHVSDSISGIGGDGIGEKVNSRNSSSGSDENVAGAAGATGVGLYRRLPSSTIV